MLILLMLGSYEVDVDVDVDVIVDVVDVESVSCLRCRQRLRLIPLPLILFCCRKNGCLPRMHSQCTRGVTQVSSSSDVELRIRSRLNSASDTVRRDILAARSTRFRCASRS